MNVNKRYRTLRYLTEEGIKSLLTEPVGLKSSTLRFLTWSFPRPDKCWLHVVRLATVI